MQISRQQVQPGALQVCQQLHDAGFQAFIVGGCVRDLLLGQEPKDWDITTDATPDQVIGLFPKTIPTGLQHGTVTVVLGEGVENHFEVTTFRVESKYQDGRRPEEVYFVKNIKDDLARRDLTINAIAYDPISERLEDPFNGRSDLELGVIRAVGQASARFEEDGLRIMRAARFAARFGYDIVQDTIYGMRTNLPTLRKVSKERISDELSKTLMAAHPDIGIEILLECGALQVACPLLCKDGLWRRRGIEKCTGDLETRLAFLYSNLPHTVAQEELTNLKFSTKEIKRVVFLLQLREMHLPFKASIQSYKQFIAMIKNQTPDTYEYTLEQFKILLGSDNLIAKQYFEEFGSIPVLSRKELAINGTDLMEIGVSPGPGLKKALDRCYAEVLKYPEHNNKEFLLEFSKQ